MEGGASVWGGAAAAGSPGCVAIVFDMDDYHNKNETWNTSIPHAGASLEMIRQRMGK